MACQEIALARGTNARHQLRQYAWRSLSQMIMASKDVLVQYLRHGSKICIPRCFDAVRSAEPGLHVESVMHANTGLVRVTLALSWTFMVVATFSIILSIITRRKRGISCTVEDLFLILSWVVGTGVVVQSAWAMLVEGQGEHQDVIPEKHVALAAKVIAMIQIILNFDVD